MRKVSLGTASGFVIGLVESFLIYYVIISEPVEVGFAVFLAGITIKEIATGAIMGLLSRKIKGVGNNMLAGLILGLIVSSMVALAYFTEIVMPGVFAGIILGFIVAKWGK